MKNQKRKLVVVNIAVKTKMVVVNIVKTKINLGLNVVLETIFLVNNVKTAMFVVNAVQTKMTPGPKVVDQPPGSIFHVSGAELSTWATFSCPSAASLSGAALLMRCADN